jgi:hypothetical protein
MAGASTSTQRAVCGSATSDMAAPSSRRRLRVRRASSPRTTRSAHSRTCLPSTWPGASRRFLRWRARPCSSLRAGFRLDRHRGQARARVLARLGSARQAGDPLAQLRLLRRQRVRHVARRHSCGRRGVRPARRRRRAGGVGRRRGAPGRDRPARRRSGRGVRVRAGGRRRGRAAASHRLPRAGSGDLPRERRAARRRRSDHRLWPARRVVRQRALPVPTRPRHRRKGPHVGLRAARRGDRVRSCRRAFWRPGTTEIFRHGYTYSGHARPRVRWRSRTST